MGVSNISNEICWKDYSFFSKVSLGLLQISIVYMCMWPCIYLHIFKPLQHCSNYCSLQIILQVSSIFFDFVLFQHYFGSSTSFAFYFQFVTYCKKACWECDWNCIISIYQFRENFHFDITESSNPCTQYILPYF